MRTFFCKVKKVKIMHSVFITVFKALCVLRSEILQHAQVPAFNA